MFLQDVDNKEFLIKQFYIWLFDDNRITNKELELKSEVDLSLAHSYLDPNIYFPKQIANFFDTKAMRRLNRISQLDLVINNYPNVYHNRLEHSKGTYNRKLENFLINFQNSEWKKYIEDNNLKIYLLADLIKVSGHDIGHLPLSHALEEAICNRHDLHEIIGQKIILEDQEINQVLNSISPFLKDAIKDLYSNNILNFSEHDEGNYDVDRLDYLSRDSLHLGTFEDLTTIPYKTVRVSKNDSGFIESKDGELYIDVYDYNYLNTIENFLNLRYSTYKNVYFSESTKISEMAINCFFDAFLASKSNVGKDLYNYMLYLKNTNADKIDISKFLAWDDISFYSQIIEIAEKHENENIRYLATMIIPHLKAFLTMLYNHLNVYSSKSFSDEDTLFLKNIKRIIKEDSIFSRNVKNPNFLYENTLILPSSNSLPSNCVHSFSYNLYGYNVKKPLYIRGIDGYIYELSKHPQRSVEWNDKSEVIHSNFAYIPFLKFHNFSETEIISFKNSLKNSSFDKKEPSEIDMQPLQTTHNIQDCFLEL